MALKGPVYPKTTWTYGERPVLSSKLNTWDDRIEAALELVFALLSLAWGGGSGVVRTGSGDLQVAAKAVPGLAVVVQPGYAFIARAPYRLAQETETVDLTPPETHPRIDLVQARLADWSVVIKPGTEAASPSAPLPDSECIALARLYLRPGMGSIKNSDDATNGYIIDVRAFL